MLELIFYLLIAVGFIGIIAIVMFVTVAPHTGAWIETDIKSACFWARRRTPHGCVD